MQGLRANVWGCGWASRSGALRGRFVVSRRRATASSTGRRGSVRPGDVLESKGLPRGTRWQRAVRRGQHLGGVKVVGAEDVKEFLVRRRNRLQVALISAGALLSVVSRKSRNCLKSSFELGRHARTRRNETRRLRRRHVLDVGAATQHRRCPRSHEALWVRCSRGRATARRSGVVRRCSALRPSSELPPQLVSPARATINPTMNDLVGFTMMFPSGRRGSNGVPVRSTAIRRRLDRGSRGRAPRSPMGPSGHRSRRLSHGQCNEVGVVEAILRHVSRGDCVRMQSPIACRYAPRYHCEKKSCQFQTRRSEKTKSDEWPSVDICAW